MSRVKNAVQLQKCWGVLILRQALSVCLFVCFSAGKPVNSLFVSPALTPIKAVLEPYSNNPAYRMYQYDNSDFSVLVRMEK